MAVDAVDLLAGRREEAAEGDVTLEMRRRDDDRNERRRQSVAADLERAADRADLRRAVEGRAGLVVDDRCAEAAEPAKKSRQLRAHPLRRAAAALAGNPHRLTVCKLPAVLLRGYAGEEHAAHAGKRQRLEHIGGAREIIAVVGVKRRGHCGFSAAEGRERFRKLTVAARILG